MIPVRASNVFSRFIVSDILSYWMHGRTGAREAD
jgi:hypothetical protein